MDLKETLHICARAAYNRRKMAYFNQNNTDPDENTRNVLLGHCFENARELSYELTQRQIKHQVIRGAIAIDALGNCPHWLIEDGKRTLPDEISETISEYLIGADKTGDVNPEIWNEIPHPETAGELPDEASHYWIEVNGSETQFDTDNRYAVDVAAEARDFIGEPHVYEGKPDQYYLQVPPESYVQPWERENNWAWNPRTVTLHTG